MSVWGGRLLERSHLCLREALVRGGGCLLEVRLHQNIAPGRMLLYGWDAEESHIFK